MAPLERKPDVRPVPSEAPVQALERVLASPEFRSSPRLSQFLRYLVVTAVEGRGQELKETVVGMDVFGRASDYDPKIDPVVRKEAGRLRARLREYYLGSGAGDTVRIDVPKGGYLPVFARAEETPPAPFVGAEPDQPHNSRRLRWAVLAGLALLIAAGSLSIVLTDPGKPTLVPEPLTGSAGDERSPSISRDGRQIAFAWDADGMGLPAIYTQRFHEDSPHRLTSGDNYENYPAWSPDGTRIAFLRRTPADSYAVCIRNLRNGAERILTEISAPDHLDWSPAGDFIATSDRVQASPSSIVLIAVANGGRRQVTAPLPGLGDTFPRFSPDGERLAFLRAVAADVAEIHMADLRTNQPPRRLTHENRKVEGYTWSPDGRALIASLTPGPTSRSLWRVPADGGPLERVAAAGTSVYTPEWAASGGMLAYVQRRNDINLWRIRTDSPSAPAIVADSSMLDSSPAFSPDGLQIAFRSDRGGTNEIWRTGLLENRPVRVTRMDGPLTSSPAWSPDGRWIAYDSRVSGSSDILLTPADSGPWRKLTDDPGNELLPRWSRDGKYVYFGSDRTGKWQIWKKLVTGGAAEQVTWGGGYVGAESPDRKYFYFMRGLNEEGLYRMPIGGGVEEPVLPKFPGKLWGNWAPTNDGVYYLDYPARHPSTESTIRVSGPENRCEPHRVSVTETSGPVGWGPCAFA